MVTMDKKQLRKGVRARLSAMTDEMKRVASQNIVSAVKERVLLSGARVVALFSPLPDEPQISSLLTELSVTMVVAVPRVEGNNGKLWDFGSVFADREKVTENGASFC